MREMRIIYIGAVDFSQHCLRVVLKSQGRVVGIVTTKNARNNSDYYDLTPIAVEHHIPIHYCKNVNDHETVEWIRDKLPDIIFCWGFSQLIKAELLSIPPQGIIGVHPALLPQNRGRHPLIWALALGLKESGLTFFRMDEGADSGLILSQERVAIKDEDDATTLYSRIKELATKQISLFLPALISGTAKFVEQDSGKANCWRKRSRKDGIIDWRMSTSAILSLVRALSRPYPGAEISYKEQLIIVWKAQQYVEPVADNIEPGKVIAIAGSRPVIKCYDGAIILAEYEPQVKFVVGDYLE
jgi:methionyl-tRNA formyltransferase